MRTTTIIKVATVILLILNIVFWGAIARGVALAQASPVSDSMGSTIRDYAIVAYAPMDDYAIGDIIIFSQDYDDDLVIHRIVERVAGEDGDGFLTQGDAEDMTIDPWVVKQEDIEGKVILIANWWGWLEGAVRKAFAE